MNALKDAIVGFFTYVVGAAGCLIYGIISCTLSALGLYIGFIVLGFLFGW
jgi:hypothetical protein